MHTKSSLQKTNQQFTPGHHQRPVLYDMRWKADGTAKPVLVFVHGFKGFKDWGTFNLVADRFAEAGFVVAKLNLSHNGTTPEAPTDFTDLEAFGKNTFSIEMDDLGAFIDLLTGPNAPVPSDEVNADNLYLLGHSRGGSLVVLKAAEDSRVKKVITWAAVHDLEARWPKEQLAYWKEKGVVYIENSRTNQQMPLNYSLVEDYLAHEDRLSVPKAVKRMQQPLLVIHGTADAGVSVEDAKAFKRDKAEAELLIIEDGDHTFGSKHPWPKQDLPEQTREVVDASIRFLKK